MTKQPNNVALLLLCVFTIATGAVARGVVSRARTEEQMEELSARLAQCPTEIDDWKEVESLTLPDNALGELRCRGYVHRIYEHQRTGHQIQVAVLLGEVPGIAVHTPQVCYSNTGFELLQDPRLQPIDESGRRHEFWNTVFRPRDETGLDVYVLHAWSTDGVWRADVNPRLKYITFPFLYKLQVESLGTLPADADRAKKFLTSFVRALRPHVADETTIP